jgi:hypothetical protein
MQISKRSIAREWLIFVVVEGICFSGALSWYYSYYGWQHNWRYWFDEFWNDMTSFPLSAWLVGPYILLTLLRSVYWSLKALTTKAN